MESIRQRCCEVVENRPETFATFQTRPRCMFLAFTYVAIVYFQTRLALISAPCETSYSVHLESTQQYFKLCHPSLWKTC